MKKSLYAIAGIGLLSLNTANAVINPGTVSNTNIVTDGTADTVIQTWIANLMKFLYLAAVIYGLWGAFNILTAGGDEDKVKTGKTIIINALIGVVAIFLVGTVVKWLLSILGASV